MTHEEEQRLIRLARDGDGEAFACLMRAHQDPVYRLALRMTGNEQDAQDISQEVFLKAYTELADFRGDSRLSVWLYRVTTNLCIDLQRKKKRRPTVSLVQEDPDGKAEEMEFPDLRYAPETQAERRALQEAISDALAQISPQHREILLLREYGDHSYEEIARMLHLTEGTVKSRLARAREKIAAKLVAAGTFPPEYRQTGGKEGSRNA